MRVVLTALVWLFIPIMVVGFGGALIMVGYAQWFGGVEPGAPFNPLAGELLK